MNEPPAGCGRPPAGAAGDAGWLLPNPNDVAEGCVGAVAPNANDGAGRLNVDGLDGAEDAFCCPNGLLAVWPNVNGEDGATLGDVACANENGAAGAGADVSGAFWPNAKPVPEDWLKPDPNLSLSSGFPNGLALAVPKPNPGPVAVAGLWANRVLPAGVLLALLKEKSSVGRSGAFSLGFISRLGLSSMLTS